MSKDRSLVKVGDSGDGYADTYRRKIKEMGEELGATALITGDILDVCHGFMERASEDTGVALVRPLWGRPRQEILARIEDIGVESIVSCADSALLGREVPVRVFTSALLKATPIHDPLQPAKRRLHSSTVCIWHRQGAQDPLCAG